MLLFVVFLFSVLSHTFFSSVYISGKSKRQKRKKKLLLHQSRGKRNEGTKRNKSITIFTCDLSLVTCSRACIWIRRFSSFFIFRLFLYITYNFEVTLFIQFLFGLFVCVFYVYLYSFFILDAHVCSYLFIYLYFLFPLVSSRLLSSS